MSANRQVSIHDLNVLVRTAQHPTIKNLDSLMGELFGQNATAIKLFKRLLHWLPYAKRTDGAVYKSARELAEEVYCSEKSVFRARALLESVGFEVFLKKAQGAPTNHYKLRMEKLIAKLAEIFNATIEQIHQWLKGEAAATEPECPSPIGQDVPMSSGQTVPNESVKVSQSITYSNTFQNTQKEEQTQQTVVVVDEIEAIREKLGTSTSLVQSWVQKHGITRVLEVMEQAQVQQREGKIRTSMVGWVRSALDHQYSWQKKEKVAKTKDWKKYIETSKYAAFIEY